MKETFENRKICNNLENRKNLENHQKTKKSRKILKISKNLKISKISDFFDFEKKKYIYIYIYWTFFDFENKNKNENILIFSILKTKTRVSFLFWIWKMWIFEIWKMYIVFVIYIFWIETLASKIWNLKIYKKLFSFFLVRKSIDVTFIFQENSRPRLFISFLKKTVFWDAQNVEFPYVKKKYMNLCFQKKSFFFQLSAFCIIFCSPTSLFLTNFRS